MKIVEKFIIETIGGKKKIKEELFGKDAYMDEMLLDLITETQIKLSGQKSLLLNMNKGEYKKQIKRRYDTQRKELVG